MFKDGEPHQDPVRLEQLFSVVTIYFKLATFNLGQMAQQERGEGRRYFGLQSFLMSLTGLEAFTNTFFHLRGQELGNNAILKRIEQSYGSLSQKIRELIALTPDGPIRDQDQLINQIFMLSQLRNEIVHPRWVPSSLTVQGNTPVTIYGLVENRQALFEDRQLCREALLWCLLVVARIATARGHEDVSGFMFHWTANYGLTLPAILQELGLPANQAQAQPLSGRTAELTSVCFELLPVLTKNLNPMNPDRIISDFEQRKLHIDFLEMSFVQNKPGKEVISYKGKGYIQQTDDDILTFKLYVNETLNTDFVASFNCVNKIQSGELYSDDSYYTLSGIAADGVVWKAGHILPNCHWHGQDANPSVHGQLSSITGGDLQSNPKSLAMHFEKADLPVLIHQVKFTVADCEFHVESGDDNFIIRAKSAAPLPEHFAMRVEEALRFLLAQSVTPRAIVQPHSIVLTSTTLKSPMVRLGPPISRSSAAFHDKSWDLFGAYLVWVIRETKFENWNSCTGYLHMAHEASANSLDAWAMGLGVAVEGLASLIDIEQDKAEREKRKAEKERLKKLQDFIVKQVSSRKRLKTFTDRIRGLVAGLAFVRAIDRMKWLADHGGADPTHVEAWQKLRHRSVHPAVKGDVDVASRDFQKMIDELHRMTVLLYHIVFYVIGYRGPYTDYATRSFPTKNYPVTSPSPKHGGGKAQT